MQREEIRPGMRVQNLSKSKYGADRWLATAEVLSVIHPDTGTPNIRIMFLDGAAEVYHSVDPVDLDYE
ncbi:hypothetical protein [Dyella acidiphila]|uniref:DUF2158 domain-containing protein n=1 Tax=Dyella acidiphila TaxID=2775866 RepID=A0ABR9GC04_9GAMM|nr:hypothetical protein [Dyella acidiphila]MBE1161570.1 hypothetical protein [Dyella acidiphila]